MYEIVSFIASNDTPGVLASLIETEGHAYRKPGAVMLFYEGGSIGSLSPGCIESDLAERLDAIWAAEQPEQVEYDMRSTDDFSWGEVIGCGGKMKLVLEPVKGELRNLLIQAKGKMDTGSTLVLRRHPKPGGYMYQLEIKKDDALTQSEEGTFVTLLAPKPRLILFGAGSSSVFMAELGSRLGFFVAAADWREAVSSSLFPADQVVICRPEEAAAKLGISSKDYVLVCSHSARHDRQFLENILVLHPRYIGILGSKARITYLLEGLEKPDSLHAPVGLPIGAEGAEEIAVSIAAELIRVRREELRSRRTQERCAT